MVIGIGGISNAGKSRLASKIKNYYSDKKVEILCQDDFAFPVENIPKINGHTDWECPESIDFNRYETAALEAIETYDIVIIEGIFAFNSSSLNKLINKKIFLTLDQRFFFMRKNNDLRWGKEPDWYIEHIWKSHQTYCKSSIPADALVLKAGKEISIDSVVNFRSFTNVTNDSI